MKRAKILCCTLSVLLIYNCYSQPLTPKKSRNFNLGHSNGIYNQPDIRLLKHLSLLKYDSVKVFYFNQLKEETVDFSLSVDTPYIYDRISKDTVYTMIKGSVTEDKGRLLSKKDSRLIITILKNTHKDFYGMEDPVGKYAPTVGFVFFKQGLPCAHIDVALGYSKIQLEIFTRDLAPYRYKRDLLGKNTYYFLKRIIEKYNLPQWVLS